jgi:nucleoside-diphosphate-sugar epimerase
MNNLIIGNTAQLSYYFPKNYKRISSRNINFNNKDRYDRTYICFAEQRTYIKDNVNIFIDTNVNYTLNVIDHFSKISNKIIIYASSELWNNCNGAINITVPFNYKKSNYIDSKRIMIEEIKRRFNNVIILYPFNFNSIYRKQGFLFYKIFDSIINEKKITIGNTYFYRELIHPRFVVEKSLKANADEIIGSGRMIFVNDFIRSLYSHFGMDYDYFVTENFSENITSNENIFYLKSKDRLYNRLLEDTTQELVSVLHKNHRYRSLETSIN